MEDLIILERKYSTLYKHTYYTAPIDYLVNSIIEYDMKSAGLSVIKSNGLLPAKDIEYLENLPKHKRNVAIGMLKQKVEKLSSQEAKGIKEVRRKFMKENNIQDSDILSIKNDAIYVIGRRCKVLEIDGVKFVEKNKYTSFHKIEGLEMYYDKSKDKLDIKGIRDDIVEEHKDGMVEFLKRIFLLVEYDRYDKIKKELVKFSIDYKSGKLPIGYYKEFNNVNVYKYKDRIETPEGETFLGLIDASIDMLDDIDTTFNYLYFVMPLLQRFIF